MEAAMPPTAHTEPSETPRRERQRLAERTAVVLGVVAAALLLGATIVLGKEILAITFLAGCIAILFDTFADPLVRRLHMKRNRAVALVMLAVFLALGSFAVLGRSLVSSQLEDFSTRADEAVQKLKTRSEDVPVVGTAIEKSEESGASGGTIVKGAISVLGTASQIVSGLLLVTILSIFLAYSPGTYLSGVLDLLPKRHRPRVEDLAGKVHHDLRRWLFSQLITMVICGVFVFVGLTIVGAPLALLLGVFTMLVQFIPYFGAFISPIPGILVALGDDGGGKLPGVIAVYVLAQFLEGWIVTPLIQERRSDLAPAVLLIFQALAAVIMGPMGVVISTPLLVVIKVLVDELVLAPKRVH
jgi:predicted PurR-regulated permease PerM